MSADTNLFDTPFGGFSLHRYPPRKKGGQAPLRAWDAADEYLLHWLHDNQDLDVANNRSLICNDAFGALSLALHHLHPVNQGDSWLAHRACQENLAHNGMSGDNVVCIDSLTTPEQTLALVVIKVPKTLALLEDQLYRLRPRITENTCVVAAGMTKNIHTSTLKLFESIIGPTRTSLAKKKARLIFCQPQPQQWQHQSPYPSYYTLENSGYRIGNHANVFSRANLDIGTRLMLEHMNALPGADDIIDLGCGNGLLGLMAKARQPESRVGFFDESYMALASARENLQNALGPDALNDCQFLANNCLEGVATASADLVLNNPPFHQGNVVGDHIAWQMFQDARRVLKPGGQLWVIGNRHLNYHTKLKKLFGNCRVQGSNRKFVVLVTTCRT
ncbi:methyltransferase [Pseudomaricurvus alkylphenolicus]|jgi:16S rRNA (guanine1207-N2)-methyltransferase|uniref:methyltransferase n=1 Tax=Pseudomaricurvus alkylphenolicus TaxID=1306991 RepID=UPI00141F2607|nr:methyltransferase [Pseudomaricurvus alkylphenolicus]NIB44257.1 methyltransferase [Pseudomaricurvus alkylphenolicus]